MCGIVGAISVNSKPSLSNVVEQMNKLQEHRGPDGQGLWSSKNGNVHFGHTRLAIIDLSNAASQPMVSQDGNYIIVFNGEIYNYKELRDKCINHGSQFKSHSDTEVIMAYIHHFGIDGIKDFRGMWSFALYDQIKNTVLISRDPFGIKPLHYGIKDDVLYFASEIKSLHCVDASFMEIDQTSKQLFLDHGYLDIGEWTFFKNIKRFRQSCYASINLNKHIDVNLKSYWSPPQKTINISTEEAIQKLDQLLQQSVERHMVSDVPIAFCLSGGLDSSTIVGIASQKAQKEQSLNTFTTHYPRFPQIDETKWAKMAVEHCKTNPHWIEPTYEDFANEFQDVVYYHDEPFGSTSIYAQNAIFKAIKNKGIKVSLDGQGADELFAGYYSFYYYLLKSLFKHKKYSTLFYESVFLPFRFSRQFFISLIRLGRKIIRKKKKDIIYSNEYNERVAYIKNLPKGTFHEYLENTLMKSSLPSLLRNGDRNSMKNHVESRVPFLDIDMVNFVMSLPDNFKIRRAITKYLLRQVSYKYAPRKLVDRKDKLGFPSPEKIWLKKLFNLNVKGVFSIEWRVLILKEWENMLKAKQSTKYKNRTKQLQNMGVELSSF